MANPNPKLNIQNLIPLNKRSKKEAKEIQRKGGEKAGEIKRQQKSFKQLAQEMLNMPVPDKFKDKLKELFPDIDLKTASSKSLMIARQFDKAISKADSKAFEVLRDTSGEKPVEKIESINTNLELDLSDIDTAKLEKLAKLSNKKLEKLLKEDD